MTTVLRPSGLCKTPQMIGSDDAAAAAAATGFRLVFGSLWVSTRALYAYRLHRTASSAFLLVQVCVVVYVCRGFRYRGMMKMSQLFAPMRALHTKARTNTAKPTMIWKPNCSTNGNKSGNAWTVLEERETRVELSREPSCWRAGGHTTRIGGHTHTTHKRAFREGGEVCIGGGGHGPRVLTVQPLASLALFRLALLGPGVVLSAPSVSQSVSHRGSSRALLGREVSWRDPCGRVIYPGGSE